MLYGLLCAAILREKATRTPSFLHGASHPMPCTHSVNALLFSMNAIVRFMLWSDQQVDAMACCWCICPVDRILLLLALVHVSFRPRDTLREHLLHMVLVFLPRSQHACAPSLDTPFLTSTGTNRRACWDVIRSRICFHTKNSGSRDPNLGDHVSRRRGRAVEFDRLYCTRRGYWGTAGPYAAGTLVPEDDGKGFGGGVRRSRCDFCHDISESPLGGNSCVGVSDIGQEMTGCFGLCH